MIYVMSDIHGNLKRFHSVMRQIRLTSSDTLYVLGDVIDRYPDGIRILKRIRSMENVKLLLGNHEYMMLCLLDETYDTSGETYEQRRFRWYKNGGKVTHDHLKHMGKSMRQELFDYLKLLPLQYDIDIDGRRYVLVHAAPAELFSHAGTSCADVRRFAVWDRKSIFDTLPDSYTLVFGHTPTNRFQPGNPLKIWHGDRRICIDCGCGFPDPGSDASEQGRLACLRLDDMREFYSE